ncbi:hypothetical protein D3C71_1224780 [compost metagenome]
MEDLAEFRRHSLSRSDSIFSRKLLVSFEIKSHQVGLCVGITSRSHLRLKCFIASLTEDLSSLVVDQEQRVQTIYEILLSRIEDITTRAQNIQVLILRLQ